MALSSELISQFVKVTKDSTKTKKESTLYGTAVKYNDSMYVQLDGSDLLTPVSTTSDIQEGDRVTVMVKDHTATVTGNISSPSARTDDVKEIGSKISAFEIVIADKVSTKELEAERARIDTLVTDNATIKNKLTASEADINTLKAKDVEIEGRISASDANIEKLQTEKLDATAADIKFATVESLDAAEADIYNLRATYASFSELTAKHIEASEADINKLKAEKLDATAAELKYANIDFSNIDQAAIEHFFATSGIIKDLTVSEGVITGELVGVTITGDLIKGGTVVADKLVIKGNNGLYYKLNTDGVKTEAEQTDYNSLNGSIITAKSITATKISVDDLVAFGATIGGFNITTTALYSGVKTSATNTTRGIYLDKTGQMSIGDSNNYLRYYKGSDGNYKLEISADSIRIGASNSSIEDVIEDTLSELEIGARNLIRNSTNLIFADYAFRSGSGATDTTSTAILNRGVLGTMILGKG